MPNSQIPTLQLGDRCADNDLDKANMLNNHCFNTSLPPLSGPFESAEHMDLLEREAKNISYALRRMFCVFCKKKMTFLKHINMSYQRSIY